MSLQDTAPRKEEWPQTLEECLDKTSCGIIITAVIECDISATKHLGQRWQCHVGCTTVHALIDRSLIVGGGRCLSLLQRSLSRDLFLLLFVLKHLSRFLCPTLIDVSVWLSIHGFGAIHFTWLTSSSASPSAWSGRIQCWCRLNCLFWHGTHLLTLRRGARSECSF